MLGDVARLPDEVRQLGREIRGVLTRAGADLQHLPSVLEDPFQDREDGRAISLARFREGLHPNRRSRQVAIGPRAAPSPSVVQAIPPANASVDAFPPPATSSAQPNTTGLTTPAPKPITERTA